MSTIESVNLALLDAYREDDLERVVRYGLDVELSSVATGRDLTAIVFRLTDWAERAGRLPELVEAVKEDRPQNDKIQALEIRASEQIERRKNRSEAVVGNLELIEYRLSLLDAEVKENQRLSRTNAGKIDRLQATTDYLQATTDRGPDLLASKSSRALFTAIFIMLALVLGVIVFEAFFISA